MMCLEVNNNVMWKRSLTISALYRILLDSQIIGLQSCAHPVLSNLTAIYYLQGWHGGQVFVGLCVYECLTAWRVHCTWLQLLQISTSVPDWTGHCGLWPLFWICLCNAVVLPHLVSGENARGWWWQRSRVDNSHSVGSQLALTCLSPSVQSDHVWWRFHNGW